MEKLRNPDENTSSYFNTVPDTINYVFHIIRRKIFSKNRGYKRSCSFWQIQFKRLCTKLNHTYEVSTTAVFLVFITIIIFICIRSERRIYYDYEFQWKNFFVTDIWKICIFIISCQYSISIKKCMMSLQFEELDWK